MKKRLFTELSHFRKLQPAAQKLLISSGIFGLAYIIIFTFINAFLFRKTGEFLPVALFNAGTFITLPLAFYLNGLLLRKISIKYLFSFGLVAQGLVASSLFFMNTVTPLTTLVFGLLMGIPMGLYWSNRNFITLFATDDKDRNYFTGVEMSLWTSSDLIMPALVGIIISLSFSYFGLTVEQVYPALGVVATAVLLVAGWIMSTADVRNPLVKKIGMVKSSHRWLEVRLSEFLLGMKSGVTFFLSTLIVFSFLGGEGTLGTLQSAGAFIGAASIYFLGRKAHAQHRMIMLSLVVLSYVVVSFVFTLLFSPLGALIYLITVEVLWKLQWLFYNPTVLGVIDQESGGDLSKNYSHVTDRELFLNLGRLSGVGFFIGIMFFFSPTFSLRIVPLAASLSQVGLVFVIWRVVKKS